MATIPAWLLPHKVTVHTFTGEGAYGPQTEDHTDVPANVQGGLRDITSATGDVVTSTATVYVAPDTAAWFTVDSSVTLPDGRTAQIIAATINTDGGLGGWEHGEVHLQ